MREIVAINLDAFESVIRQAEAEGADWSAQRRSFQTGIKIMIWPRPDLPEAA